MGIIESRTFKSGNSVAVRLPKELGFAAGTAVTIEKIGNKLEIKPAIDPEEQRRRNKAMADEIRAIWAKAPYHEIEKREPIEFPERPGL